MPVPMKPLPSEAGPAATFHPLIKKVEKKQRSEAADSRRIDTDGMFLGKSKGLYITSATWTRLYGYPADWSTLDQESFGRAADVCLPRSSVPRKWVRRNSASCRVRSIASLMNYWVFLCDVGDGIW